MDKKGIPPVLSKKTGLTVFGAVFGTRHYCHIVFVCSWAKSAHIFGGKTAQLRT